MKYRNARMVGLGLIAVLLAAKHAVAQPQISPAQLTEAKGSYIFVFKDQIAADRIPAVAAQMAHEHAGMVRHHFKHTIKGFSANMSSKAAQKLSENPLIAYYEQNGIAYKAVLPKTDRIERINANRKSRTVPQVIPYGVERIGGSRDGTGLHAWVIDTGIDLDNADLNVGPGVNMVSQGKNTTDDGDGHGTHVAGIIAAKDNSIDVIGVAPNATVHPIRVLNNNGSGYIDWIVAGIDYVAANASYGDVANLSLGAMGHFQSLHDAVLALADKGVMVSIAAGNSSDHANFYEPAHVEHPNVYTVSAIDSADVFAWFSNYGNPPIDFAAPGVNIPSNKVGGGIVSYSGTSMAAPHIAGLLLFAIPSTSGYAISDVDNTPDPIGYQ